MTRYIDAESLASEIEKYNKDNWDKLTWTSRMVHSLILNVPTVDAVEVVRCKDCKHCRTNGITYFCDVEKAFFTEHYFCAKGERMG